MFTAATWEGGGGGERGGEARRGGGIGEVQATLRSGIGPPEGRVVLATHVYRETAARAPDLNRSKPQGDQVRMQRQANATNHRSG